MAESVTINQLARALHSKLLDNVSVHNEAQIRAGVGDHPEDLQVARDIMLDVLQALMEV